MVELATLEEDPIKRLGFLGMYLAVTQTNIEKCLSKPFNPLLGETFEFVSPGHYKFLAE